MTSKKDPPKKPADVAAPTPTDPLAGQPVDVVIEVLANAGGRMQGLEGAALQAHLKAAVAEAQRVVADVERKNTEEEQRKAAAAEIAGLIDTLIRSGTGIAQELQKQREPIINGFRAADIQTLASGMQQLADWMINPGDGTDAQAKALIANLQKTLGPVFGIDPEAAEESRRAQMKADVRKSLDDAFRGKDFAATLKKNRPPE